MEKHKGELIQTTQGPLNYLFIDNQQETTLVLLHGNSSSVAFWKPLMEGGLRQHFNFLAFDLPGHGHSPIPEHPDETYSLAAYAQILQEIVSKLKLKEYVLFGHSLGGHIILQALNSLNGCKAAFVIGTPPLTIPLRLELAFQMSPQFINFMQAGTDPVIMEATFKSMFPEEKESLASILLEDYFRTDPQARVLLAQNIQQGKFIDEFKVLQSSRIPVYLLSAEADQMVNPAYFRQLPAATAVISVPAAGHYAPLEHAAAFEQLILEKFFPKLYSNHA